MTRAFNENKYDFLSFIVNTFPMIEVPLKVAFGLACQKRDDNDTFTKAMERSKLSEVAELLDKYLIRRHPDLSKKIICRDPQLFVEYFDSNLIKLKFEEYIGKMKDLLIVSSEKRHYELIESILTSNSDLDVDTYLIDYRINQIYRKLNRNPYEYIHWKKYEGAFKIREDIVLKKFGHDKYLDRLTVFIPYLKVKAPKFYELVINDKSTLMNMVDEDIKIVQEIVDYLIYGNSKFINNLNSCYMKVLTILLKVEDQALKEVIMKCCYLCKDNTNTSNVISTLNLFSKKTFEFPTWRVSLRLYLLDYIRGSTLISDIFKQEGAQEYSVEIIKRNGLPIEKIDKYKADHYKPSGKSLPKEIIGFDVEIRTFKKTFQVYKTVLMSQSTFFYALLNSDNWNSKQYLDNITEYVIEYCYGLFLFPKDAGEVIEIIQTAHSHEIPEMIGGFSDFVRVDNSNFNKFCYLLANLQVEFYQPLEGLIRKLVSYAFDNYATFTAFEIERLPPCVIYPLMELMIKERKERKLEVQ